MDKVSSNSVKNNWLSSYITPVFLGSFVVLLLTVIAPVVLPELTPVLLSRAGDFYMAKFPHWIIWSVSSFLVFALVMAVIPSIGRRTLGTMQDQTQFSYFSWFSMIFGVGMGVGLLTWGIAEPIAGMQNNPDVIKGLTTANTSGNISSALKWSYAHWGFAGWAAYAIVGLAIAYTGYRQRMPLTIRTALVPLFGNAMKGTLGHIVDIATVVVTLLSIIQILGYAVDEFVIAISQTFAIPELVQADGSSTTMAKIITSVGIMCVAAITAMSGIARGIKWLSNINMLISLGILAIMLVAGSYKAGLFALFTSVLDYLMHLPSMMFHVWSKDGTPVGDSLQAWQGTWSMYHWAGWWLAFSPFIGVFLAKISKGRTIRQYLFATVVLPAFLTMIWMSWVGGNALNLELNGIANGALINVATGLMVFSMVPFLLEPWMASLTSMGLLLLIVTYLVTSIDSALIVTSTALRANVDTSTDSRTVLNCAWIITAIIVVLILANGLSSIRSVMVLASAPISILIAMLCVSLGVAIYKDK